MSDEIETPEAAEEAPKPRRKKAARKKEVSEKGMRRRRRARETDGRLMAAGPPKIMNRHGI